LAKLSKKIAQLAIGDILGKGFTFLASVYLARTLGAEGFGLISIAIASLGYFIFFADFGLHNIGSREIARKPKHRNFTPMEIYVARIIMALSMFLIGWFGLPFIIKEQTHLELTRFFLLALIPHAFLLEWFFNGRQRFMTNAISKAIQHGIYALLVIVFIKGFDDLNLVPLFFTSGLVSATLLLLLIASRDKEFSGTIQLDNFPKLIKAASSVGSGLLFAQLVQLLPPIAIGYLISTSEAGLFGVAYRLIVIGLLIDRLFVPLLLPNLSKQWSENPTLAASNLAHTSRMVLLIGALLTTFFALGAEDFTIWVFGNQYLASVPIVEVLSLFLFFTFLNSIFSHGLVAISRDRDFFFATSIGGAITLILVLGAAYFLDARFVALAVVTGEIAIGSLCYLRFKRNLYFKFIKPFLISILIASSVYFVFSYSNLMPWLNAGLSSIALLVLFRMLNVLRREDIDWIKSKLWG